MSQAKLFASILISRLTELMLPSAERFALHQTSTLFRVSPSSVVLPSPSLSLLIGYPGIPPGAPDRPQAAVKGVSPPDFVSSSPFESVNFN